MSGDAETAMAILGIWLRSWGGIIFTLLTVTSLYSQVVASQLQKEWLLELFPKKFQLSSRCDIKVQGQRSYFNRNVFYRTWHRKYWVVEERQVCNLWSQKLVCREPFHLLAVWNCKVHGQSFTDIYSKHHEAHSFMSVFDTAAYTILNLLYIFPFSEESCRKSSFEFLGFQVIIMMLVKVF